MSNKMICPVCKVPLTECGDLLYCPNNHCGWVGNAALWKALKIAHTALKDITKERCAFADWVFKAVTMTRIAEEALEKIEHKE